MVIKILAKGSAFTIGAVGPVMVGTFHGAMSLAEMAAMEGAYREMVKAHPKFGALVVIPKADKNGMTPEVKQAAAELSARYEQHIAGSAVALTLTGLAAMIVRTFMLGLNMLSKSKVPQKVFTNVDEAAAWVVTLPGLAGPPTPEELKRALAEISHPQTLAA